MEKSLKLLPRISKIYVRDIIMLVTILTPVRNAESTISETTESVLHQTYDDIEYIIIDGGSMDDTLKIAESYKASFNKRLQRELIIESRIDRSMYDAA